MTFDRAVMTFKIVNQLCPEGLQNKFIERSTLSKCNTKDLYVKHFYTKKVFCTLVQKPGIVSHSSSETRVRYTTQNRSETSPFELIENRFCTNPWKINTRERVKHILSLYCKLLIVVYFLMVSYLTEWMLCLNKIK